MAFGDREYEVYAILGGSTAPLPWVHATWGDVSAAFDPLIRAARDRPAVRSDQLKPEPGSPNQRAISFGRIGWNELGARKWTHKRTASFCPAIGPSSRHPKSGHRPGLRASATGLAPDAYFAVKNESDFP